MTFTREEAIQLAMDLGLKRYQRLRHEDAMVLVWQAEMLKEEEFLKMFPASDMAPSRFFKMFHPPNALFYHTAEDGSSIDMTMWFEPAWFGAFIGIWIRKDVRHSQEYFQKGQSLFALGFSYFDILGAITTQQSVIDLCERMGAKVACELPYKMNDRKTSLIFYTKEAFERSTMNPFRRDGSKT